MQKVVKLKISEIIYKKNFENKVNDPVIVSVPMIIILLLKFDEVLDKILIKVFYNNS